MNYEETINFLFARLPMFHRIGPAAYKDSLENTLLMDAFFGHPHQDFKTVHVAGTNGKGSVSHMLAAVFQKAGYKTGLYTSPHLVDFRERIKVNGEIIGRDEVTEWVEKYALKYNLWNIEPSFFELTVAMAFDFFARQKVDIAVIEVGLGGRLDSTNIITPEISVITNISLDHTQLLGNTLEKIAFEKAGIIKPDVPVVIGETNNATEVVFRKIAKSNNAPIYFADKEYKTEYSLLSMDGKQVLNISKNGQSVFSELKLDLLGVYQQKNVPTVLQTLDILIGKGWKINDEAIYNGLSQAAKITGLMGRWQIIGNNPLVVCDTGHNEDGLKMVMKQIGNTAFKKLHIVFGVVADKDLYRVLPLLPVSAEYYFTKANLPRALNEQELMKQAAEFGLKGESYQSVIEAFEAAKKKADKNDFIFVGGSTFVVAEILQQKF
ncbi:MAG TPA: dihydrofolate synthase [Prolixibacteraceae bacterium]|nr:dihydrofolate synthase [Prolixibacteraceae bacterium]